MNGGKSPREKGHPVRHGARHLPHIGGKRAMMKISYGVTRDIPDGRPWPPPDSNALWAEVRRADGCTLWRAIEVAQVRSPLPRTFAIPPGSNRNGGDSHD
jgi:hypothetical protein